MERTQAARVAASRDFPGSPVFDRRCLSLLFSTAPLLTSQGTPSLNAVQRGMTDKKGLRECRRAAKAEAAVVTFRRGRRVTGCVVDA